MSGPSEYHVFNKAVILFDYAVSPRILWVRAGLVNTALKKWYMFVIYFTRYFCGSGPGCLWFRVSSEAAAQLCANLRSLLKAHCSLQNSPYSCWKLSPSPRGPQTWQAAWRSSWQDSLPFQRQCHRESKTEVSASCHLTSKVASIPLAHSIHLAWIPGRAART